MVRASLIQRAQRRPSGDAEDCALADVTEGKRQLADSLEAQLRECFGRVLTPTSNNAGAGVESLTMRGELLSEFIRIERSESEIQISVREIHLDAAP